ncbi:MAG: ATP-dependent Clp protease ATP-binding subunit [Patescibacteria group bacterium]|jgi:ATP-dependent Clp protease ATP-binding subunit ClpC
MLKNIQDKFSEHLRKALLESHELAYELRHQQLNPEHLLYGLTVFHGSLGAEILNKFKIDTEFLRQFIAKKNPATVANAAPKLSIESKKIIQRAILLAGLYRHQYVSTEHLLAAILDSGNHVIKEILSLSNINTASVQQQLNLVLRSTSKFHDIVEPFEGTEENSQFFGQDDMEKMMLGGLGGPNGNALELFTTDLTAAETQKNIDPVVGREEEIERLIQILCRRTKNNPVLLGDPGVGKTAIVEGLAKKIMNNDVPEILLEKKIMSLDLGLILAGTMYRGEFEQRLKNIIGEIKKDQNIIIFIDEIHTLTGAGAAPGSMDAANILKPALARGEIRCIGATTLEEYRKHIESDAALERRFQPIAIKEPSPEKTIKILEGIKQNYEKFHRVMITPEAIKAAVKLSTRYITDRFLPDKAIDLIDEAAAKIKINTNSGGLLQKIKKIERGLESLRKNKRQAIMSEKYSEAIEYKNQEQTILTELKELKDQWSLQEQKMVGKITDRDIAQLVAKMTGIPLAEMVTSEKDKMLNLESILKKKIIGQDDAIKELAKAIRRSRAGISPERRPIGSFIFLGPSGVGKTELAKTLAMELFEDQNALIKIDMSEFKESFNVSKLIGSPPGYVGYKESGQLTEAVRRKPYSVVLFDEIEKAHPEIFNILLQVMEDGELTDATGKKINFKNTVIIMTSNIGLKDFVAGKKIGFDDIGEDKNLYEEMKGYLEKSLTDFFRPEFVNRLDKIIVFRPLLNQHLKKIVQLQLAELNKRLSEHKIKIKTGAGVVEFLAQKNFNPQEGARLIRKNVQELISNPLSNLMLENKINKGGIIKLQIKNNQLILT